MTIQLNETLVYSYIFISCALGFLCGIYNYIKIISVDISNEGLNDKEGRVIQTEIRISTMKSIAEKIDQVI